MQALKSLGDLERGLQWKVYCICGCLKHRGERQGIYLALHVLSLLSSDICGCLKVQHGLALLPLILLLVFHLGQPKKKCNVNCF